MMEANQFQQGCGMFITQMDQMKGKSRDRRRPRPAQEHSLSCPRCKSTNTKFCYYNNYSLSQPRHLCKTCRRYWTEGGSLRNVPIGGGTRRNKTRPHHPSSPTSSLPSTTPPTITTISPSSTPSMTKFLDLTTPLFPPHSHIVSHRHDLNLGFPPAAHGYIAPPHFIHQSNFRPAPAMELLSGIGSFDQRERRGVYGLENCGVKDGAEAGGDGTMLFPFGEMKEIGEQQKERSSSGWWNGVLRGASSSW